MTIGRDESTPSLSVGMAPYSVLSCKPASVVFPVRNGMWDDIGVIKYLGFG